MSAAVETPVYGIEEISNCQIAGTNLLPGTVAGDNGDEWAIRAASRAAESAATHQTPEFTAETINAAPRHKLAGRHVHHRAGVWVKFCPHVGCDSFVLTYGNYVHVPVMVQHALEAHQHEAEAMLG